MSEHTAAASVQSAPVPTATVSMVALEKASNMFRAMGDPSRLRLLYLLVQKEWCVGDLVETLQEKFSTVSQRLRLLRSEGLVRRRRQGTHLYYVIQDRHVADLIHNALAHAKELVEEGSALSETDEGEADTSVTS